MDTRSVWTETPVQVRAAGAAAASRRTKRNKQNKTTREEAVRTSRIEERAPSGEEVRPEVPPLSLHRAGPEEDGFFRVGLWSPPIGVSRAPAEAFEFVWN